MNLYLLTQSDNTGYDSMVIAAESTEDAKHLSSVHTNIYTRNLHTHQSSRDTPFVWRDYYQDSYDLQVWSLNPTIELISESTNQPEGVVCASFNAG